MLDVWRNHIGLLRVCLYGQAARDGCSPVIVHPLLHQSCFSYPYSCGRAVPLPQLVTVLILRLEYLQLLGY